MIYKNIEKLVLNTPNNMELGEKIRELYWKERDELEKEILRLREGTDSFDSVMANVLDNVLGFEESNEVGKRINLEDKPLTPKRTTIKGSYKDELPPSDYQLDN
tara:strand:+ start:253 stop:564 length:312 start_codon:yes stop_codon:yes gene_type:complete